MQIIFQDPYSALNPTWNVEEILSEPLDQIRMPKAEQKERMEYLLNKVGMKTDDLSRFPHEFSGGQRQRIGIARALTVNPEFIMCDEPIAALDVSIQAQVVNMLEDLQHEFGLTYLFAAHDLSMVRYISNRIGVMYLGHLVEMTDSKELYEHPLHPYTKALLSAIPIADPIKARSTERIKLQGELPSPMNVPDGCHFAPRCPYATEKCRTECPKLKDMGNHHFVACHLV
jgi:oligopeptide transport system ATP-binding protein